MGVKTRLPLLILITVLILIVLVSSMFFTACDQKSAGAQGGIIKISEVDPTNLGYPPKFAQLINARTSSPALETLLRYDEKGNIIPWLATDYKFDTNAKAITLTLRKNVKFHDGTDFNADAVKWNIDQSIAAKLASALNVKSVDAVDDFTIRINLTKLDSTVIPSLALIMGTIISPTAYKTNGEEWSVNHPVGTGPFQFVEWQKTSKIVYKKSATYWQPGKPHLDGVQYIIRSDPLIAEIAMKAGDFDFMQTPSQQSIADFEKSGYIITRNNVSGALSLVPDSANQNSPWSKLKVRQAAQYAIDTTAINKAIFFGEAANTNQWTYPGSWSFNASVAGYPYDPSKAKQLLAEAGYPNGFSTKILYWPYAQNIDQYHQSIQRYFVAVGINAELQTMQMGQYYATYGGGTWEGLLYGSYSGDPDIVATAYQRLSGHSSYYKQMLYPEDYVQAIDAAFAAPDMAAKQKAMQEFQKLLIDKYCLQIIINSPTEANVRTKYVKDLGPYSYQTHTWEDVWLDKK